MPFWPDTDPPTKEQLADKCQPVQDRGWPFGCLVLLFGGATALASAGAVLTGGGPF